MQNNRFLYLQLLTIKMRNIILMLALIFLIGCKAEAIETSAINSITLDTDKDIYHSNEIIHLTSKINSQTELNSAEIRFYGIDAGGYRLDHTITQNLNKGDNIITFDYQAPRCYGCAGIKPGTYEITAIISYNHDILATTAVNTELRQ